MKAPFILSSKHYFLFLCFFLFTSIQIGVAADFKILAFHKTNGYRHTGAINAGITMLETLGTNSAIATWDVDNTTDASVFTTANLAQYDVIVFLCTSGGGLLDASQKAAMEAFIQGGKGFVGYHSATDTYRNTNTNSQWLWYNELVGGIVQSNPYHTPNNTQGTMNVLTDHVTTDHLGGIGATWVHNEEWYYWEQNGGQVSPNNVVLLEVEATGNDSYDAKRPITWYKNFDGGRSFYTALGHNGSTYSNDQKFRTMSEIAILWAADRINTIQDCTSPLSSSWTDLLAEDFTCWELWMGVPHTTTGLPGSSSNVTNGSGTPLGLNNDPANVFSIIDVNGEKQLYITGEVYGGLTTINEYSNYHLSMQFKWGTLKWEPRLNQLRDSGILYHAKGNHGTFWDVWKASLEMQVQETDCGDFYSLANVDGEILASNNGGGLTFDPENGSLVNVGKVNAEQDLENPNGQWNTLEVIVIGDRAIHYVNGVMVNALENATYNGNTVTQGQIQIQSEGAEVYYRDIKIRTASEFPEDDAIRLGWVTAPTCDTNAPIGDTISLKKIGGDENWVTKSLSSTNISADADLAADADLYVVETHPLGCVAFKSVATGKYLQTAGGSTTASIRENGNAPGTWEQFGWEDLGNNQVAILSLFMDGWLQADWTVDDAPIIPGGTTIGDYETFGYAVKGEVVTAPTCDTNAPIGDTISLKKIGGDENWIIIGPGSTNISASADLNADADLFVVETHPLGCVAFKSVATGKYLQTVGGSTTAAIRASGNAPGIWEQFGWEDLGNNQVAILSLFMDGWLQADWTVDDAPIIPGGTTVGDYETFGYAFSVEECLEIDVTLVLEGPYDPIAGLMNNNLYGLGLLPTAQPYNTAPWNYTGTEGDGMAITDFPANSVDWVLISLRSDVAPSTQVLKTAAMLLSDGSLFLPDCELVGTVADGAYYIVVEHRNHMGVMSASTVSLANNQISYNFSTQDSYSSNNGLAQKDLSGVWALFSGDFDQSDFPSFDINGQDKALWNIENGNFGIYSYPDSNLDGDINGDDNIYWQQNSGVYSTVPK